MPTRGLTGLCILLVGCAGAAPKPDGPLIDKVSVDGANHLKESDVGKKILSTGSSWLPGWMPFFGHDEYYDPSAWQADLRRIERYYQSQGYYQARVLDENVAETKPGHVALTVKVEEGEQTKVTAMKIEGLGELPPELQASVQKSLHLTQGSVFLEEDWANTKEQLLIRLREAGYAEAVLEAEATVDLANASAVLTIALAPGQRYKFGKIFVSVDPEAQVPAKRIAEQVESAVHPGDWYSESALAEAQGLVFQMGVFGAVKVNRGAPDRPEGTVPVVVDVREAPFHTIRLGPGLGIDSVRQEVRLLGEYTDRNFFGGLRRFTLRGKAGIAFLPTIWGVAASSGGAKWGPVFQILTEFEQPHVFVRNLNFQASLVVASGLEPGYGYYGGTARVGLAWRPSTTLTIFPSYNLDIYRLSTPVPLNGGAPELLFGCPLTCVVNYFEQTVEWDRRDNKLEPKSGTYLALSLQEGFGGFTYFRVVPEARGYLSFGEQKKVTLAGKVKVGTLLTPVGEDSPIISRFFSGGSSMRGFSSRRLSPLLAVAQAGQPPAPPIPVPAIVVPGETLPIGGNGLFEASVEVRWNVWDDLVLSVFDDTGMVTAGSLDFKLMDHYLYTAIGIGARYRTPLGPIRVDLAFRLPVGGPQNLIQRDTRTLDYQRGGCFGLGTTSSATGGYPEGVCAFHLSIGEAF